MGDLRNARDGKQTIIWWLFNVFFPYQKWLLIGILAGIIMLGTLIYDLVTVPQPDFFFLMLTETPVSDEEADALAAIYGKIAAGPDSERDAVCAYQIIHPNGNTAETARLEMYLSDWHYQLVLADAESLPHIDARAEAGYWIDLTEYGVKTIPGKPYLADLSASKVLPEAGLDDTIQYAVIQTIPQDAPEESTFARVAAVQCIWEVFLW